MDDVRKDTLMLTVSGQALERSSKKKRRVQRRTQRLDEPCADYDEPLEGEQGSVVDTEGAESRAAAALCCAAGAYFALFERPLLALGAYRHARGLAPHSAVAACGMADCLQASPFEHL